MPKYAVYDPQAQGGAAAVIAWLDTDGINAGMAVPAHAVEVNADEWAARRQAHHVVQGGTLAHGDPLTTYDGDAASVLERATVTNGLFPGAVFSMDEGTVGALRALASDAMSGLGLPGDAVSVTVHQADGSPIQLSATQVISLYKAMRDLRHAHDRQRQAYAAGETPVWPEPKLTLS